MTGQLQENPGSRKPGSRQAHHGHELCSASHYPRDDDGLPDLVAPQEHSLYPFELDHFPAQTDTVGHSADQ
ncbi:hypothetical protein ColLi_10783 [Colletotrichum liriopes]|uniref:Uncharacterized protein n=1 Tax=Colletotrichum liriopes TaxID=708192 RepID=A0AA37GWG3_9PEZI|nr:hypothetical protein ColLi_10783 [Colletotrichum liriopes]